MNPEMPQNIDFNSREIYPQNTLGEKMDFNVSSKCFDLVKNKKELIFETTAKGIANVEKSFDGREFKRSSVIFQQEITKDILAIKGDNPKKNLEEAKEYWKDYDNKARIYAGRFESLEDQQKVLIEFEKLKVSVQGSLGAIRFFEKKGFKVKFPAPDEDVFKQCDLIMEKSGKKEKDYNLAIQLKSYKTSAKDAKETKKESEKIFSTDYYDLADKEQQESFAKLRNFCLNLSRKEGKNYFPIFMNMPVSIDARNPKKNEPTKYSLVDERGFLKPGQLKPTMDTLWNDYDKLLTKRNK